ncbi:MAG: exosortase/archaeosortase family protein [Lacipirellulaceae bacterium]
MASVSNQAKTGVVPVGFPGAKAHDEAAVFSWGDAGQRNSYVGLLALIVLLVYSFWNTLATTSAFWSSAQYSHGWIVPLIALYLLWARRPNPFAHEPGPDQTEEAFFGVIPGATFRNAVVFGGLALGGVGYSASESGLVSESLGQALQGVGLSIVCVGLAAYVLLGQAFQKVSVEERWIGLGIIVFALAARTSGAIFQSEPVGRVAFVVTLLGAFAMLGGWALVRWAGPAVLFLLFMFPLPTFIETLLLGGLQKLAALASEVILTILNTPVIRQGNRLMFSDMPDEQALFVAEACSGLRMLTIFGALAVAMVFLINRPWWDKFTILLSAIPIALVVNIIRIVVTALLFRAFPDTDVLHQSIHDHAGLAMMPLAMGLLYFEMKILGMLTQPEEGIDMQSSGMGAFAAR